MATGSYVTSFEGIAVSFNTSTFSISEGDYVFVAAQGAAGPVTSILPTTANVAPTLTQLAIIEDHPDGNSYTTTLFGGRASTTYPSARYQVNTSSGPYDGRTVGLIYKVVPAADETLSVKNSVQQVAVTSGTSSSLTTSSAQGAPKSGDVVFGVYGSTGSITLTTDSDTTNGSWTSIQDKISQGSVVRVLTQLKNVTGTGNQTYNVSSGTAHSFTSFVVHVTADPFAGSYWGIRA